MKIFSTSQSWKIAGCIIIGSDALVGVAIEHPHGRTRIWITIALTTAIKNKEDKSDQQCEKHFLIISAFCLIFNAIH